MATTLRNTVSAEIGTFLLNNGLSLRKSSNNPVFVNELVSIVNSLSDYYEEGTHLYPEVLLTNNMSDVSFFVEYVFFRGNLKVGAMSKAIKMCAPLCNEGWCIFIEVNDDGVRWGVVNGEEKITNLSLLDQLRLSSDDEHRFVLLHNIGAKTVEFVPANNNEAYSVSLSLSDVEETQVVHLQELCTTIGEDCKNQRFCQFLQKIIGYALQVGHGN